MKRLTHRRRSRLRSGRIRCALAACAASVVASYAVANNDTWKTAANGNWESNASWTDNSVPGNSDQATFNLAGTYAATLGAAVPADIQDLFVTGSGTNVRLQTGLGGRDPVPLTLNVTSSSGGKDAVISGGATLTLGPANPLTALAVHLIVGDDLTVSGSTLNVGLATLVATDCFLTGGTLNIGSGGNSFVNTQIGNTGGTATATINGAGAMLTNTGTFDVGVGATGVLTIQSGGAVSCTSTSGSTPSRIGVNSGQSGTVTVTGAGSSWTTNALFLVGDSGSGTLNITAGGQVQSGQSQIGSLAGSTGTVTVDASTWITTSTNSITLVVGQSGSGTLNIINGGLVQAVDCLTAGNFGGTGNISVDGVGSRLICSGVSVGGAGPGTMNIMNGALVQSASGQIGNGTNNASISSTVNVSGAGSRWDNSGGLAICSNNFNGSPGPGTLNILDGGTVTVGGDIVGPSIFQGSNISTLTLDGGALDMQGHSIGVFGKILHDRNFRSGTLRNVGNIGPNQGLVKTTAGTLALDGTNTYGGTTTVSQGTLIFATTYTTGSSLNVANGALAQIAVSAATPNNVLLKTAAINTNSSGRLDVTDNKVIVSAGAIGTASGGVYTGLSGLIQSGRNGGGWGGSGIVTSQSSATSGNFTSIGIATAQQVKGIAPTATATWAGLTVTGTDALIMYTYGGDANLDGKINVDDYGRIDFNVALGTSGWFNGDFNYDGKINVDDYGIIDFNIGIQGAPFSTGGAGDALTSVPEPSAALAVWAGSCAARFFARRRRNRGNSP